MILEKEFEFNVRKECRPTQSFSQHHSGISGISRRTGGTEQGCSSIGLPKQEYCYRKCMGREVVVQPNPRVHKALKTQMTAILAELERIAAGDSVPDELLSTIDLIAVTMQGLKGENANE